jgi:hypothetical protein
MRGSMLSDAEVTAFGAVGALVALLVVQVLPLGYRLASVDLEWTITPARVLGLLLIVFCFLVGGGVVALVLAGDEGTTTKNAIVYGLGWQASLGGFLSGSQRQVAAEASSSVGPTDVATSEPPTS